MNSILRIQHQRNFISNFIDQFSPEDYLIHSDNDEIPNLEAYNLKNNKKKFVIFKQKMFYYKFNLCYENFVWFGSKIVKKKHLISPQWLRNIKSKKYPFWRMDVLFSKKKYSNLHYIKNGGWHFTCIRTPEDLEKKLLNFAHHYEFEQSGLKITDLKKLIKEKRVMYDHSVDQTGYKWSGKSILKKINTDQLPLYIKNNKEKFRQWLD